MPGLAFTLIAAHLHRMRVFARLLLLLAAFAYGSMPMSGMSVMAMPMAHGVHGEALHGANLERSAHAMADVDCPHAGSMEPAADHVDGTGPDSKPLKMTSHCAACLTLPAMIALGDNGKPARAAEAATLSPRLLSQLMAPLTPPPRA